MNGSSKHFFFFWWLNKSSLFSGISLCYQRQNVVLEHFKSCAEKWRCSAWHKAQLFFAIKIFLPCRKFCRRFPSRYSGRCCTVHFEDSFTGLHLLLSNIVFQIILVLFLKFHNIICKTTLLLVSKNVEFHTYQPVLSYKSSKAQNFLVTPLIRYCITIHEMDSHCIEAGKMLMY